METTLALIDTFLLDLTPTQMLVGTSQSGKGMLAVVKAQPAQLSDPGEPLYWLDVIDEELEEHVSQRRPLKLARIIPWLIGAFSKNDSYDLFLWMVEEDVPPRPWPIT